MKYAPKKVFILENGLYKEITYSELKQLEQADKSYMDKFFLPLYGMLMEVTEETYKEYYRDKRRQKYIDERSKLNGDVSYNALDTDETLGEDILADRRTDVEMQVINQMTVEQLRKAFLLLSPDERELITAIYIHNLTALAMTRREMQSFCRTHRNYDTTKLGAYPTKSSINRQTKRRVRSRCSTAKCCGERAKSLSLSWRVRSVPCLLCNAAASRCRSAVLAGQTNSSKR